MKVDRAIIQLLIAFKCLTEAKLTLYTMLNWNSNNWTDFYCGPFAPYNCFHYNDSFYDL